MDEGIRAVVVKCHRREEDGEPKAGLEMLRLEIEELKGRIRQLEGEPDLSQVVAKLPKIAPGQLLFRTE
jgi:hypothetical protein